MGIVVYFSQIQIGDNARRNHAIGNAISAIAKGKVGIGQFWRLSDIGQAIFGFTKRTGPGIGNFRWGQVWVEAGKQFEQLLTFLGN